MPLTTNFNLSEFQGKDGSKIPDHLLDNVQRLANALQTIRNYFNAPIFITSGYRSPGHNATIKGAATGSKHIDALAADFWVDGRTPLEVYKGISQLIIDKQIPEGGLGLYSNRVHYDIRGTKARWNNTTLNIEDDSIVSKTIGAIEGTVIMFVLGKIANLF